MEIKYKCIKSYTNNEIGVIYGENDKPKWFKNFNSIKEYKEKGIKFNDYFEFVKTEPHEIHNKSLVGRYFKVLKRFSFRVKEGDYLKITGDLEYDCYTTENYGALDKRRFEDKEIELMPEGFEPKSEEEFVLPEKWCVKITNENKKVLDSWRRKQIRFNYLNNTSFLGWLVSDTWIDNTYCSFAKNLPLAGVYKEITFEQFKKYVLKEDFQICTDIAVNEPTVYNESKSDDRITYSESIQKEPTLYIKPKQNLLYTEDFKTNELDLPTLIRPKKSLLINH